MIVLVDTCVWSMALRRNQPKSTQIVAELQELVSELRVQIIGPIRQEILSGIRSETQFARLKSHLQAFPDLLLKSTDFELAAEFYNSCRQKGVQGSNTDFLMCAISAQYQMPIFTEDKDFINFKKILPIQLHSPR